MSSENDIEIDPEGEELIRIICGYLADALENVLEETEYLEEEEAMNVVSKHISKKLNYLSQEGWIDEHV
jgi:hypothetical protein